MSRHLIFIFFLISIFCFFLQKESFGQIEKPLFNLLSSEQTGVDFNNIITDEPDHNILIYSNYYGGAGVGVGDFNKDGLADIFFAGNLVSDRLYINKGDLKFDDRTDEAGIEIGGGWSSGVLIGDINNDGWEDIYVTRELYDDKPELRKNKLYINQQDGTFKENAEEYGVADAERTRHATFIDYDKDGWLDLFLLNQPPNPGNYSPLYGTDLMQEKWAPRLYKNNQDPKGTGVTFSDVSKEAGISIPGYGNSVVAADLNNDKWMDLYVANDYEVPDRLFLNNQDGTFTDVIHDAARHISYYAMGVDAADINNDGWLDVMTLDMVAEDNFRLKANMGGMYPEAFWKIVNDGGHHQYMFNALHLNNGVAPFGGERRLILSDIAQMAGVPSTDWSWSNIMADFDNDGWKDIFVTNGLLRDIRNSDAAKSFPKYVEKTIQEFIENNPNAGEIGIFDILDLEKALELIPSVPLKNYIYKNNGGLTFSKKTTEWGMDMETFSNGCAYADLDNDGDLEIIVNNINESAHIFENTANNNWLRFKLTYNKKNESVAGTKVTLYTEVNEMQYAELTNTRGMYSTSENMIHFGLGKKEKVKSVEIVWPNGLKTLLSNPAINKVHEVDFLGTKVATSGGAIPTIFQNITDQKNILFIHQENNFDDYEKQILLPHKMSQFGPAMDVADVNGDGLEDVYMGGAVGQAGVLFIQKENKQFEKTIIFENEKLQEDIDAVFFDIENDGDMDLYVVSGGNEYPQQNKMYQDRLYINDGKGSFEKSTDILPVFRESGACVKPADFDGDGDMDLFIGGRHTPWLYPSPTISRLLKNENGKFIDITKTHAKELINLGMVTDAVWSDYDKDDDLDLIVVGEWMPIAIFINENGSFIHHSPFTVHHSSGWWYSIEAADIDGDGDDDYFAGNLGLNYKYKATTNEPFEVHYDDFDESGSKDIVLSYYNFGEQFPLRGRSCSSQQVPEIQNKFPSYNIFANANLEEVYGDEKLDNALHYSATNFASVFIKNNNGDLEVTPLPNEAQVSSINDFLIKDFNGDKKLDVLVAGNLYPAEIETPRNDAGIGLLLTGDGKGSWQSVHPTKSNLYVPFDVKKIKTLGDWILFGVNDGALQVFSKNYKK